MNRLELIKDRNYENLSTPDKNFLRKEGHFNGVGPDWFPKWLRKLTTFLFGEILDRERHDFNCLVGGNIQMYHKANWGILKYSFVGVAEWWRYIHFSKLYKKILLGLLFLIILIPVIIIILISYSLCEYGGKRSFNFHT